MERAHGYAQSVLSLGLQPARAEVLPHSSGDVLRLDLRLWNLWPTCGWSYIVCSSCGGRVPFGRRFRGPDARSGARLHSESSPGVDVP